MKNSKLIKDMAFNIIEDLAGVEEYRKINSKIVNLQKELQKELSEAGNKIFMELSELEAESETFAIDYSCNKAFLRGIALGQAAETTKFEGGAL